MTVVDIQLSPGNCEWDELRAVSEYVDGAGFGALWVFDHLAGVALDGRTMLETFAHLGALAVATTSIPLGVLVANVWNRQLGTLVTAVASVARISHRQFFLGLGAGTSPAGRFATEQHIVGATLEPAMERRHDRVTAALDLMRRTWSTSRGQPFDTFPLPSPTPLTIVGVNSVALSTRAGQQADGINVPWRHPRRDELFAAGDAAAAGRPFLRTTWAHFDAGLLDPEHPERIAMRQARIDRLVLTVLGPPSIVLGARPG